MIVTNIIRKIASTRNVPGLWWALGAALLVGGCGTLMDMGKGNGRSATRRVYLNDPAPNDSLPAALSTQGIRLVMQPGGKQYTLVAENGSPVDSLDLYVRKNGALTFHGAVTGTVSGNDVTYTFAAPNTKTVADYYLIFLRGVDNLPAAKPTGVRLFPVDTTQATTMRVRLHMVRGLEGLNSDTEKMQYAAAFHAELQSIFATYGVTVDTSTAIVEGSGDPMSVTYDGGPVTLPGVRLSDAINVYLVNSIEGGDEGSVVVGYAPREAFDLSTHEESRVVLNAQGSSGTIVQRAQSMAVTAAHEIGHFLGLRHTSATRRDRDYDNDESNRYDGFASTQECADLEKRSAVEEQAITVRGADGQAYCLRVAGTSFTCACPDVNNLMYPYKCTTTQKTLGADQQQVMRNNLKVYQ